MNSENVAVVEEPVEGTQVDLISLRAIPAADFAHTVCLSYLTDSSDEGKRIFDHAIHYCGRFFVPVGVKFVSDCPSTGLGGYDFGGAEFRRGPAQLVMNWLRESTGASPVRTLDGNTHLIADRSGVIGGVRIRVSRIPCDASRA